MRTNIRVSWMLAGVIALAGCSTTGYQCPVPRACSPVHVTYQEARHDTSWSGWKVKPLPEHGSKDTADPEGHSAGSAGRSGATETVRPIYVPPHPWRAWLAPWSDGSGRLVSGSYVWFTTPGHWRYLGRDWPATPIATQTRSSAQGILAPVYPNALGFVPGKAAAPEGVLQNMAQPFQVQQGSH